MNIENVEQIIRDLARDNFYHYPEDYKIENGLATEEAITSAQELGISYFDNRQDDEIERDEQLNIAKIDYIDFVMAEYEAFVQNKLADNEIE